MILSDFLIRIILAIVMGLLIGLERQLTGHQGDIKTTMLISLGSCLFILFSSLVGGQEKTRIAAQVVSGVGFLCSGVIFKDGFSVNGLNTAATIWCTAAIGALTSTGYYLYSILATLLIILTNLIFRPISNRLCTIKKFDDTEKRYTISVISDNSIESFIRKKIIESLENSSLILVSLKSKKEEENKVKIEAEIIGKSKKEEPIIEQIINSFCLNSTIYSASWNCSND